MKGMLFFVAVSQITVLCTFRDYLGQSQKMIPLLRIVSAFSELLPTYLSYYDPTAVLRHFSEVQHPLHCFGADGCSLLETVCPVKSHLL